MSAAAAAAHAAAGFRPLPPSSGFISVNGPLYLRHETRAEGDLVQIG